MTLSTSENKMGTLWKVAAMLYECRDTYIDLSRVVAVSQILFGGGMRGEGGRFNVALTGIEHGLWIRATDTSPQAGMALETDREGLLANWRRYKSARRGGGRSVYALAHLYINLIAVSALTGIHSASVGSYMAGATPSLHKAYTIYVSGMRDPIVRLVGQGVEDEEALHNERQELLSAWAAVQAPLLRKGAA